ncbi:hypothetical protein SDC9_83232 [bioreactor metagenome]|uniref:Uncharacterized protein n=1 Tax=bioreactor metagenome TaxID=1076179 RepID=A0A644ZD41_9ZZZZ
MLRCGRFSRQDFEVRGYFLSQSIQGGGFIHRGIDGFQIGHQSLDVLVGNISARIAQLMDDAVLNFCFRTHRLDRRGKTGQIVRAGDENVLHTLVFQAVEHGRPELGALVFAHPHAPDVLPAAQINSMAM